VVHHLIVESLFAALIAVRQSHVVVSPSTTQPESILRRVSFAPTLGHPLSGYPIGDKEMNANPDRILRLKSVLDRTGLSRSTMYRKIREGTFPEKVKISINGTGWRESAINLWIEDPAAFHMRVRGSE
jgi:prophage regulatory protein